MVKITIDGFPEDLRRVGAAEIKEIVMAFEAVASVSDEADPIWRLDHIDEIRVTANLEEEVRNHLRAELGDIADTYKASRHGVMVQGHTASRYEGNDIRSTITLAADGMGDFKPSGRLSRTVTLCHEIFHAIGRKAHFDKKGAPRPRDQWI